MATPAELMVESQRLELVGRPEQAEQAVLREQPARTLI
jgi:hypothetical protein